MAVERAVGVPISITLARGRHTMKNTAALFARLKYGTRPAEIAPVPVPTCLERIETDQCPGRAHFTYWPEQKADGVNRYGPLVLAGGQ